MTNDEKKRLARIVMKIKYCAKCADCEECFFSQSGDGRVWCIGDDDQYQQAFIDGFNAAINAIEERKLEG